MVCIYLRGLYHVFLVHGIIKPTVITILIMSLIVSILRILISKISITVSKISTLISKVSIIIHGSAPLRKQEILGMPTMYLKKNTVVAS